MQNLDKKKQLVAPVPSASVVIVRDGLDGIEILLLKRSATVSFAPNNLVFPGGTLEPGDTALAQQLVGAGRPLADVPSRIAAIRETFEESNILLAQSLKRATTGVEKHDLEADRAALLSGDLNFADFLNLDGLSPTTDQLLPLAHWIAPELAPKRFSTQFYLAKAPADAEVLVDGSEIVEAHWLPARQLDAAQHQKFRLMFPTRLNCRLVGGYDTVEQLWQAMSEREVPTVMPDIEVRGEELWLLIPEAAGYGVTEQRFKGW